MNDFLKVAQLVSLWQSWAQKDLASFCELVPSPGTIMYTLLFIYYESKPPSLMLYYLIVIHHCKIGITLFTSEKGRASLRENVI